MGFLSLDLERWLDALAASEFHPALAEVVFDNPVGAAAQAHTLQTPYAVVPDVIFRGPERRRFPRD